MVQSRRVWSRGFLGVVLLVAAVAPACELQEGWPWVRNMFDSPGPQPQDRALQPPDNTLPIAGGELTARPRSEEAPENPESGNITPQALERGKTLYDRFCSACHGQDALGKELTADFESPDLTEDYYLEVPDGDIYTLIAEGGLNMPAYGAEIQPRDRWLIINHFRTLQRRNDP